MKTNYLNLIAKSYIKLTKENDDNLAIFFFQKYNKLKNETPKNRFFNKLIENIENLINNSYTKAKEPDLSGIPDEHLDDYINELKRKKNEYLDAMDLHHIDCIAQGIPYDIPNWEICTDATKLTNALNNDYVELEDPINIITPRKKISKKELIVRKSKLEYLKSEAERASKAEGIDNLDEKINIEHKEEDSSPEIRKKVEKAFQFTLQTRGKKNQLLSNDDYERLVGWVTEYFENIVIKKDDMLPVIDSSITVNLKGYITYIRYAFKLLEEEIGLPYPNPDSFYKLGGLCFADLKEDKPSDIQKTTKPIRWK